MGHRPECQWSVSSIRVTFKARSRFSCVQVTLGYNTNDDYTPSVLIKKFFQPFSKNWKLIFDKIDLDRVDKIKIVQIKALRPKQGSMWWVLRSKLLRFIQLNNTSYLPMEQSYVLSSGVLLVVFT